jgi:dye decolorizing peroxidase
MATDQPNGLSRRALIASGTAGAAGIAVGAVAGTALGREVTQASPADASDAGASVPFYGRHQAGVTTPAQDHGTLIAFDLKSGVDDDALRRLLRIWTDDISRLMSGSPGLADTEPELASRPHRLTVTVAVGAGAVKAAGVKAPSWLGPLPTFTVDRLDDNWSGGDLLLQVCADDEMAVAHAVRLLTKEAREFVRVRWVQRGFRGPRGERGLPRNLMGQVDGTSQPAAAEHDRLVWIGRESTALFGPQPAWLHGGTTMVVRRIAMNLDTWDEVDRPTREQVIGRRLADGVALTGGALADDPDFDAVDQRGLPVIDQFAHVRRARTDNAHQRFLRRPFNYDDAPQGRELSNSGLIFVTFQADVDRQFVPIQRRLAEVDLLNAWTTPIGSAIFAVLPGVSRGGFLGEGLFTR